MTSIKFGILVLLTCCLSSSLSKPLVSQSRDEEGVLSPRVEEARKLWNKVKKTYHQMQSLKSQSKRSSPSPRRSDDDSDLIDEAMMANITGAKYFVDLYKNLSNHNTSMPTRANTVRSLPFIAKATPVCGEYNFSLAAIKPSEFILKSELRLFLSEMPSSSSHMYVAEVHAHLPRGEVLRHNRVQVNVGTGEQYFEFNVERLIKSLIQRGESHAVLVVHLYKDASNQVEIACKDANFVYNDFTDKNIPMLIVYSNDPSLARVKYQALTRRTVSGNTPATPASVPARRRRRSAPPACAVQRLTVKGSEIFSIIGDRNQADSTVVTPIQYNAGICGGSCDRTHPQDANTHAQFIHALLARPSFTSRHRQYTFTQCCAPVAFEPIRVWSHSQSGGETINVISDMKVTKCNCIDIVSFR